VSGPLLALDSSTRAAWVAVGEEGRVLATESVGAGANASSALLPAVDRAVAAAGLVPGGLAGVVVSGGPGSFTGVRIAAATAKGVARGLSKPLRAASGLLALGAAWRSAGGTVAALLDARNREVFAGCWRFADGGAEELLSPCVLAVEAVAERLGGQRDLLLVGDGAVLHRPLLERAFGAGCVPDGERSPAEGLLWLAHAGLAAVVDARRWEPEYLRAAGAVRVRAGG
jgi:tRNA threonylcarbamoyladenosine biosynthesis protein TsaB